MRKKSLYANRKKEEVCEENQEMKMSLVILQDYNIRTFYIHPKNMLFLFHVMQHEPALC